MFNFLKKKKSELPPPLPPQRQKSSVPIGDFPVIMPGKELPAPKKKAVFPKFKKSKDIVIKKPPILPMIKKVERPFPRFEKPAPKVFDKTIHEQLPKKRIIRPKLKPIFVDIEDYRQIVNNSNVVRSKLLEAEDFAKKLNHLKTKESKILDKWQSRIEEIDKKLNYVDKVISKAQR